MEPISTRVEQVTLYHRGATVRRTAQLDWKTGAPAELLVAGLPLSLADHTLRVRLESTGGELILSNVRVGLWAPPRGTPARPPDAVELRQVERSIATQHERLSMVQDELERLRNFPVLPRPAAEEGKMPTASPMHARFALEQLADEAITARIAETRKLRDELTALEEKSAALHRALELASTADQVRPDELTKSVQASLVVVGPAPTGARLVLEYFVSGARWAPAYQCRMSRDCRQAEVQLRAMICQRTGEDWSRAQLKLSTASPMSWTELPELSAIKIGKAQPPLSSQRGFRPPPLGGEGLFADFDRSLAQARASVPVIPSWSPPQPVIAVRESRRRDESPREMEEPAAEMMDDSVAYESERSVAPGAMAMKSMAMPPPAPAAAPMRAARAGPPAKKVAARASAGMAMDARSSDLDQEGGELFQAEALVYAQLLLATAEDGTRGKLKPIDRSQAYLRSLLALKVSVSFDVMAVVAAAEAQGARIHHAGSPSGTCDVRSAAGFYDYTYSTDAAVDLPSDGTFHSVPVSTRTASSDVLYVTVPREDTLVYRQAQVKNPLASPLLPGPVEVYVAGEYVLTTALPAVAPGGDFKLSLGVEQAIKVARNAKFREQRSGDKVVATNELIHEIDIELVNNLDREVQCEVRERVPQPAPEAEVVVDEGPISPAWDPYNQEERGLVIEGGRRWRISVKPGATQKLGAQYRVKLYANNELTGGNRREA